MTNVCDPWQQWLMHTRYANDPQEYQRVRSEMVRHADRVLAHAELQPGLILLDLGSGDGLVALRALEALGIKGQVILSDLSAPMLEHAEQSARDAGVHAQCTFLRADAQFLHGVPDASVDVVTARAVLAYVPDKAAALRACYRVLRPGGRISICEPILIDEARETCALRKALEAGTVEDDHGMLALVLRWKAAQSPDSVESMAHTPMTSFTERDMVRLATQTGFSPVHMELHVDVRPDPNRSWNAFKDSAPHPYAPSLRKILEEQFSAAERALFEQLLRPRVESASMITDERVMYLSATKPVLA